MRTRLFLAPGWVQGLVAGLVFAVYLTAFGLLFNGEGWSGALITGVLSGAFFGAFSTWWATREQLRWRRSIGRGLSGAEQQIVHRAASKGPVPVDPPLRVAALRGAMAQLERHEERRRESWATLVVTAMLAVLLGLFISPWWFLMVVLAAYSGYNWWATSRRVRARIEVLSRESEG